LIGTPVRVPPTRSRGRGIGSGIRVIRRARGIRPALAPIVTGAIIVPILPARAGIGPGVAVLVTAAGGVLTIIITPGRVVTVIITSRSVLAVIIARGRVMTVKIPFRAFVIAVKIPLGGLITAIIIPAGVTLVTAIPAIVTVAVTGTVVAIAILRLAIRAFRATGTIR
jgi:hypothetical protein